MKLNHFFKHTSNALLLTTAVLGVMSCEEDRDYAVYQDPTDIPLTVNVESLDFKGNATQAQTITIKSAVAPTVTVDGAFVTSSIQEFTPNYEFRYNILPKASLDPQNYTVKIKSGNSEKTIAVKMTPADPGFLGIGFNLGNHFDTSNMQWGYWDHATPTASLYTGLAEAGFNSVRIPITWTNHMDELNVIDPAYMAEVVENVDNALNAGLKVIVNTHHDSFETALGESMKSKEDSTYYADLIETTWVQIAIALADRGKNLMFETFNEVHDGDNWSTDSDDLFAALNKWNQIAVDAIRATGGNNATRCIGISGYAANAGLTFEKLVLPNDPGNNLAVSIHCYDPYNFCLEASVNEWGKDSEKQAIDDFMFKVADTYLNKGIQVYLGEFGCSKRADAADEPARLEWLNYFTRMARTYGLSLMLWDNANGAGGSESHAYIDHNDGSIVDETALNAIFGGYNNTIYESHNNDK